MVERDCKNGSSERGNRDERIANDKSHYSIYFFDPTINIREQLTYHFRTEQITTYKRTKVDKNEGENLRSIRTKLGNIE